MIVYLAGVETYESYYPNQTPDDAYILSSFFYHHSRKNIPDWSRSDRHILDSGAFSTFKNPNDATKMDWTKYVNLYIEFIKETKQKLFFEIDIDAVVGLPKVEYYRNKIEDAIGIPPIPVWHSSRGWDYFCQMTENYPYVALGTTKANEQGKAIRKNPSILDKFIKQAHKNNSKIHGLGFTNLEWLEKLKFDSVDSTTWLNGAKFGSMVRFQPTGQFEQIIKPLDKKMINPRLRVGTSFNEWLKYQKWALKNL
jgi:hypothetical protein